MHSKIKMFVQLSFIILLVTLVHGQKANQTIRVCRPVQQHCYVSGVKEAFAENFAEDKSVSAKSTSIKSGESCLDAHNRYRAAHGIPALKQPSAELQAYADKRGQELASTDNFSHPAHSKFGENLFMGFGKDYSCQEAVKSWYDEIKDYDYNKPVFSSKTGHFTQVIWKGSTQVACATTKSQKSGKSYVVVSKNSL